MSDTFELVTVVLPALLRARIPVFAGGADYRCVIEFPLVADLEQTDLNCCEADLPRASSSQSRPSMVPRQRRVPQRQA